MKIGVLGLGAIGSRHALNLKTMGHTVIGFDPDMKRHLELNGWDRDEILDTADAVVIATPTAQHYQDLIDCIAALKPAFVEKPIAATHQELRDLQKYLSTTDVFVGTNLRFHSCVLKAKEWLASGRIGQPLWASFTVAQHTVKPPYLRDGVILNWGSHEIDLAMHLLGPALVVSCASARIADGRDVIADCIIVHETRCRSAIHMDYVTDPEQRHFQITGTEGVMRADLVKRAIVITDNCRDLSTSFIGRDSFDENYVTEMKAWLDRIAGKETLGATGEDGLRTLEACLEVRRLAGLS